MVSTVSARFKGWISAADVRKLCAESSAHGRGHAAVPTPTPSHSPATADAQKSWRRLDGHNQLPKMLLGVKFADGLEVTAKSDRRQPTITAA
jgi:hypothetical protein